ncbi:WD40/YVTN/BNR-like repeat-containing protein [Kribbella sp. NBC_00359]|uniref:WD40/YVTN/BNR-like repeat-containing protein n=1 Tax=Kribbella sp. NBC_00359 TaxID=2975966 RepID=UPI002E206ED7
MSLSWRFTQTVTPSLAGIEVVNRQVVWASGSFIGPDEADGPGIVVRTIDGGASWTDVTPPGGEHLTFRDIRAFDRDHALALASGFAEDSKIYRTTDGGIKWNPVFVNQEPKAFYDGIAFFDRDHGIALSDPVGGKFRILTTDDGGRSWKIAPKNGMPPALPDEFGRATGTCLVAKGPRDAWFGTQPVGPGSRVFHTRDRGRTWSVVTTPIPGDPDFGIASLAFWDTKHGLALGGGDPGTNKPSVVAATADGGATWTRVGSPAGFRTNMALIPTNTRDTAVAVGFSGSDITTDGGRTWHQFDQADLRGVSCKQDAGCWAVGKNFLAAELMQPISATGRP